MQNLKSNHRLLITDQQNHQLFQMTGACRAVWNFFLAEIKASYNDNKKFRYYEENANDLTLLKQVPEYEWLRSVPSTALQQQLRYLDNSLKKFIKDNKTTIKAGFPKFKKKKTGVGSMTLTAINYNRNIKRINGKFYFKICGLLLEIQNKKSIPTNFKSCTIKYDSGWYISFTYKINKAEKREIKKSTGIDLNSREHVTTDETFIVPKPFIDNQVKLKGLQRTLSRRKPGSNNYNKCLADWQKLNKHCRNIMNNFCHNLTKHLVNSYDLITIEDLYVSGMQQKFGKIISNNCFSLIRHQLEYKSEIYGSTLHVVDRWYPSSQICSECGSRQKMKLKQREYNCPVCGMKKSRDLNSATNLNKKGLELILADSNREISGSSDISVMATRPNND